MKNIIIEIGIGLLVLIAVVLILGVTIYEYIPIDKNPPVTVQAYELDEETENEISTVEDITAENVVRTYRIEARDLKTYEYTNEYDKGKANPFAIGETKPGVDSETDNVTSGGTTANSGSTDKFFNTVGK